MVTWLCVRRRPVSAVPGVSRGHQLRLQVAPVVRSCALSVSPGRRGTCPRRDGDPKQVAHNRRRKPLLPRCRRGALRPYPQRRTSKPAFPQADWRQRVQLPLRLVGLVTEGRSVPGRHAGTRVLMRSRPRRGGGGTVQPTPSLPLVLSLSLTAGTWRLEMRESANCATGLERAAGRRVPQSGTPVSVEVLMSLSASPWKRSILGEAR